MCRPFSYINDAEWKVVVLDLSTQPSLVEHWIISFQSASWIAKSMMSCFLVEHIARTRIDRGSVELSVAGAETSAVFIIFSLVNSTLTSSTLH